MSRVIEIQISQDERQILLRRHDFFVTQAKSRLLAQFADIADEAERCCLGSPAVWIVAGLLLAILLTQKW